MKGFSLSFFKVLIVDFFKFWNWLYRRDGLLINNSSKGKSLIPDRLIFLDKIRVVVIDYKTGVEEESHLTQLKKYEQILKEMGLKVVKKILVYIADKIEIKIPK